MPTKKVTCPKGKPVLVTVYVERPKRKASSNHPHQHYPCMHHTIKREAIQYRHGAGGQGYISRRAELLQYSQRLRLSARSAAPASRPFYPKPNHTKNPHPPAKLPYPQPQLLRTLLCNTLSNKVVVVRLWLSEESQRIQKLQAALETGKFSNRWKRKENRSPNAP